MGLRTLRLPRTAVRFAVAAMALTVSVAVAGAAPALVVKINSSQNTALGKILVNSKGHTLYYSSANCSSACAATWPPVLIASGGKPTAGVGVTPSKLGTKKRSDGTIQVTYGGRALSLYSGDKRPGDVKGQGENGWHAISPTGALVLKPTPATTGTSSTGSSSGSTGSGGTSSSGSGSTGTSSTGTGNTGTGNTGTGTGGSGTGSTGGTDCDTNPNGYGCM